MSKNVAVANDVHELLLAYCQKNGLKMTWVIGNILRTWLKGRKRLAKGLDRKSA